MKAARITSKGMSETGSRICDYTGRDMSLFTLATAMFADDGGVDSSKWKEYSNKQCGRSITWYGDSCATKHMGNMPCGVYDFKLCKGVVCQHCFESIAPYSQDTETALRLSSREPHWFNSRRGLARSPARRSISFPNRDRQGWSKLCRQEWCSDNRQR